MNLHRVNALIESSANTFETMLSMRVDAMAPISKLSYESDKGSISAIVSLSGDLTGTIVVTTSTGTAKRIASVFTGSDVSDHADNVCDAMGELAGMIAEGAVCRSETDDITCACPSVIIGVHQTVAGRASDDRFVIPFRCECGEFSIAMSVHRDDQSFGATPQRSPVDAVADGATP